MGFIGFLGFFSGFRVYGPLKRNLKPYTLYPNPERNP